MRDFVNVRDHQQEKLITMCNNVCRNTRQGNLHIHRERLVRFFAKFNYLTDELVRAYQDAARRMWALICTSAEAATRYDDFLREPGMNLAFVGVERKYQ